MDTIIIIVIAVLIIIATFIYFNNKFNTKISSSIGVGAAKSEAERINRIAKLIDEPSINKIYNIYNDLQSVNVKVMDDLTRRISSLEEKNNSYRIIIDKFNKKIIELEEIIKNIKEENLHLKIENKKLKELIND